MEEIVNRVANSKLITFDLEDIYPKGLRVQLDIAQWLYDGIILKEKDFRVSLAKYDWSQYKDAYVALYCSTDAIIPSWAYMLVTTYLNPFAHKTIVGTLEQLETILYTERLFSLDFTSYKDQYVIVKGCSDKKVPDNAYLLLVQKLQDQVASLMFGEACSSVPLFKRKKE